MGDRMSMFHVRLLRTTETTYLGAAGAFQAGKFHRAEVMSHGTMSMAAFLEMDPDTPEDLKVHGKVLYDQAKELAAQARPAWIGRETEGRLSGPSRILVGFRKELDRSGEEMKDAARQAIRDAE